MDPGTIALLVFIGVIGISMAAIGIEFYNKDEDKKDLIIEQEFLIDPEGYIFSSSKYGQIRLSNASVTIYKFNKEKNKFILWDSKKYNQNNPQITGVTGEYSFLVPAGEYYISASKNDYKDFQSDKFSVTRTNPIHLNIELKRTNFFKNLFRY